MRGLFVTELCVGNPGSIEPDPKKTQDAKQNA